MTPRALLACLACAAALTAVRPARANGRFPAASQLAVHPRDPSRLVLRTTYGLLFSKDGGSAWDWVCERAIGYGGVEDPSIAIVGNGSVLAGMFTGLTVSPDFGCNWKRDPLMPEVVVDLALRTLAPDAAYAISGKYSGMSDAGSARYASELFVTVDGGAHWARRFAFDSSLLLETVEVAPSDPKRVYVSAIRDIGKKTHGVLLVSDDDGEHWVERQVALEPGERAPFISGVDPQVKDRIYIRTSGAEKNRLLLSDDAGKTTRTLFTGTALLGFALSEDGEKVYLGGTTEGLHVARRPDYRFEKKSPTPVQCLAVTGKTLWACTVPSTGFILGASLDDGATFASRLTLGGMRGPLACQGASSMTACPEEWNKLRAEYSLGSVPADAGTVGAEPLPAPQSAKRASGPCGCSVIGTKEDAGDAWRALAVLIACLSAALVRRART